MSLYPGMPNVPKAREIGTSASKGTSVGKSQPDVDDLSPSLEMVCVLQPKLATTYLPTGNFLDFDSIILKINVKFNIFLKWYKIFVHTLQPEILS